MTPRPPESNNNQGNNQRRRPIKELYIKWFRYYQYQTEQKLHKYEGAPKDYPVELAQPFKQIFRNENGIRIDQDESNFILGIKKVRPAETNSQFVSDFNTMYPFHEIDESAIFSNVTYLSINGGENIVPQYAPIFVRELPDYYGGRSSSYRMSLKRDIVVLGELNKPATLLVVLHEIGHENDKSIRVAEGILDRLNNPNARVYYDEAFDLIESEEKAWEYARKQLESVFSKQGNKLLSRDLFEQFASRGISYYTNLIRAKIDSGHMEYRSRRY